LNRDFGRWTSRRANACALLALALAAGPVRAQMQAPVLDADARTSRDAVWVGAGALLVGAALLDRTVESAIPDGGGMRWKWASSRLNYGGRPQYPVAILAATYAGARLARAPRLADAAEHVGIALLASGVANGALKVGVGRARPSFTDDPHRFRPMNLSDRWQSFPSGHATVAFSLAASVSEEAHRPWVTALTYGGAALVGWSRVYDDRHWTSDVVAGAMIGAATSRWTVRMLHARRAGSQTESDAPRPSAITLTPLPAGVMVSIAR
jgi:membrane-associated phospholipid phosphatase